MEGYPMRQWSIDIWLLDDQGNDVQANVFDKATYNLHPSFEKNKHGAWRTILAMRSADRFSHQEAAVPHRREGLGRV
jgi:hypothetical protein